MSDTARESFTDKVSSALKASPTRRRRRRRRALTVPQPDDSKTMTEQAGDTVKGAADSAASALQPQVRPSCAATSHGFD